MYSVTVGATALALPVNPDCADDVYRFIDTLLDWSQLLEEGWIKIHVSKWAEQSLYEDGLFPERQQIKSLLNRHGITEYDFNTLVLVPERLVKITPSFQEYFCLDDVLMEKFSTVPELTFAHQATATQRDTIRCIVLVALLHNFCRDSLPGHSLVIQGDYSSNELTINSVIHEVDHSRTDLDHIPLHPEVFCGSITIATDFRSLLSGIDHAAAWIEAQVPEEQATAIRLAVYKLRLEIGEDPEWDDVPLFRFGDQFLQQCETITRAVGNTLANRLLRSIAESLLGIKLDAVHALRINRSGGSPQRRRASDNAKAWRRDIDREYHLHYWECEGGLIELGWVGPHNDERLPE